MSGVQNVLEPSQDNGWIIHCLAHTMAEDVVHSATYYESSSIRLPVQERLAEKLASLAIIAAFKEAVGSESFWSNIPSSFSTRSLSYSNASSPSDRRKMVLHSTRQREVHMDTEMSGNGETHQFNGTIKYHSSGSSSSTLRPSKDTHSSGEVSYEERGPHGRRAKLMAYVDALYVDALSDEITTWMTNNMTNIDDLSLICDQMVDQIITSSMSEVRLRKYVGRLVSDALSLGWEEQKAASLHDSLVLRQEQTGRREPNPVDQEAHLIVYPYPTNPNQSSRVQLCSPKTNEMDLDLTTNTAHPPAHSPTSVISQSYPEDLA